jgi:phage terminase large subunit-like protein
MSLQHNFDPRLGGGWNRKTTEEHVRDGTYRRDRHGPLPGGVLDYPKPPWKMETSHKGQAQWCRSAADEQAIREGCFFNERMAVHAAEFFPRFLRHSKGQWAGQPFDILPWQRDDLIYPLFGWLRPDGSRRFRRVFIEIPKKNGKSTLASGIGLYMLCADGESGAEVYSVASDRDQAAIVHREATNMVEASEPLSAALKLNRSTHNIHYKSRQGFYRALAANPAAFQGLNIHCCIIDELHVWRGREGWDALRYGFRSRTQPLQFVITTAGDDDQSVCYSELERARRIIRGDLVDLSTLALVYEAQPSADWQDEATWAQANPSLGHTFTIESLREDAAAAKGRAAEEASFKRYTLNIWGKSANTWLSMDDWEANRREFSAADMMGRDCYMGLDLSRTRDMTAVALVFPWEEEGRTVFRQLVRFWMPEVAVGVYDGRMPVQQWHADGWLDFIGDDYQPVEAAIVEAMDSFNVIGLAYDVMYARDFVETLEREYGLNCIKFPQTVVNFAGPTAEYERLLAHNALHHNGNPVLTWQAGHVQVKTDGNANKRPIKPTPKDYRKIDGIVAGIMAVGLVMANPAIESAYADGGMMYAAEVSDPLPAAVDDGEECTEDDGDGEYEPLCIGGRVW